MIHIWKIMIANQPFKLSWLKPIVFYLYLQWNELFFGSRWKLLFSFFTFWFLPRFALIINHEDKFVDLSGLNNNNFCFSPVLSYFHFKRKCFFWYFQYNPGNIIAALHGGDLPLTENEDSRCYNYSLPSNFNSPPTVAVSVHAFDCEPSQGLYFFVKPLKLQSVSILPFVIRTQWSYTKWNHITFSFIAEDRTDI